MKLSVQIFCSTPKHATHTGCSSVKRLATCCTKPPLANLSFYFSTPHIWLSPPRECHQLVGPTIRSGTDSSEEIKCQRQQEGLPHLFVCKERMCAHLESVEHNENSIPRLGGMGWLAISVRYVCLVAFPVCIDLRLTVIYKYHSCSKCRLGSTNPSIFLTSCLAHPKFL